MTNDQWIVVMILMCGQLLMTMTEWPIIIGIIIIIIEYYYY